MGRIVLALLTMMACVPGMAQNDPNKKEWIQLFNGKNLDGWEVKIAAYDLNDNFGKTFRVENGVMKTAYDQYGQFNNRFGHIFYHQKFSYYIIAVEYRFVGEQTPGAPDWAFRNSGIMVHSQSPQSMKKDQDFPICIEVQLLGGKETGERPTANVCTPGTNIEMNVKLIRSPQPLRLTTNPAWDGNPAFSPDGQSIAFARKLGDRVAIILIPAIGGPERLLAEFHTERALSSAWFPDGKWIAIDGLALISVETGEIRKLTSLPTKSVRDYHPAISPDGRTVAFSRYDGASEIYLLGLTPDLKPKGEPKRLTFMNRQSYRPTWTADGREVVFTSAEALESSLWRVSVSGSGDPKPLLAGGG